MVRMGSRVGSVDSRDASTVREEPMAGANEAERRIIRELLGDVRSVSEIS